MHESHRLNARDLICTMTSRSCYVTLYDVTEALSTSESDWFLLVAYSIKVLTDGNMLYLTHQAGDTQSARGLMPAHVYVR